MGGHDTTREDQNCFITAQQPNSKKRPDLTIHEAITGSTYNKELADVSVTTPMAGVFEGTARPITNRTGTWQCPCRSTRAPRPWRSRHSRCSGDSNKHC